MSIQPFTSNPGNWYILTRSASLLDSDEVKMALMLANMKNDIFALTSIIILPKVLSGAP